MWVGELTQHIYGPHYLQLLYFPWIIGFELLQCDQSWTLNLRRKFFLDKQALCHQVQPPPWGIIWRLFALHCNLRKDIFQNNKLKTLTDGFHTKTWIPIYVVNLKHRKNCECCHHHSLFKGHNVNVNIVVLNCQKCNQCLKCQVSGHKSLGLLFESVL